MNEQRVIKAGTTLTFGKPADPMPRQIADRIAQAVAAIPAIVEAHLPLCHVEGDDKPRQILVICVTSRTRVAEIMQALEPQLEQIIPPGEFMDTLPYETGAMPTAIREIDCQIFSRPLLH
jgi:hypothetical protein